MFYGAVCSYTGEHCKMSLDLWVDFIETLMICVGLGLAKILYNFGLKYRSRGQG